MAGTQPGYCFGVMVVSYMCERGKATARGKRQVGKWRWPKEYEYCKGKWESGNGQRAMIRKRQMGKWQWPKDYEYCKGKWENGNGQRQQQEGKGEWKWQKDYKYSGRQIDRRMARGSNYTSKILCYRQIKRLMARSGKMAMAKGI